MKNTRQLEKTELYVFSTVNESIQLRFLVSSCKMIFEGNLILENLRAFWTVIASGHGVLCLYMAPHVTRHPGLVATLWTLEKTSLQSGDHGLNISCKIRIAYIFILHIHSFTSSSQMIIQGNFVFQNFRTLWATVTSGHNVLGINVALDISWNFGLISTL